MALPNLSFLSTGPPTGPIFKYTSQQSKRIRSDDPPSQGNGNRDRGKTVCPILHEEFKENQEVYSFPGSHQRMPYDIVAIYNYLIRRERDELPLTNPTNSNEKIPPHEWEEIKEWIRLHKNELILPVPSRPPNYNDSDDSTIDLVEFAQLTEEQVRQERAARAQAIAMICLQVDDPILPTQVRVGTEEMRGTLKFEIRTNTFVPRAEVLEELKRKGERAFSYAVGNFQGLYRAYNIDQDRISQNASTLIVENVLMEEDEFNPQAQFRHVVRWHWKLDQELARCFRDYAPFGNLNSTSERGQRFLGTFYRGMMSVAREALFEHVDPKINLEDVYIDRHYGELENRNWQLMNWYAADTSPTMTREPDRPSNVHGNRRRPMEASLPNTH